ncbi:DUF2793 domain-containing protein [Aquibaculum sediminis]|uniref:DUF2793 domain-containing protein n=1 Tax=Aquibaculum sediminis TaxID=3231907 RepID=UPI003456963B
MSETPRLGLPYLDMGQAQKEMTHNAALARLDGLVQVTCLEVRSDPPAEPAEGAVYLVGDSASGAWEGQEDSLAAWHQGWHFTAPEAGWRVCDQDRERILTHDGSQWRAVPELQVPSLDNDWIGYGSGYAGIRYFRDAEGRVTIEGVMQAGSDGVVFTLLEGYRPADTLMFCCWSGGGPYRVDVRANGEVEVHASNTVFSSLAGISFIAAG